MSEVPLSPAATSPGGPSDIPPPTQAAVGRVWYRSSAPARPSIAALAQSTVTSTVALLLLVVLGEVLHESVLIPPLAASMALIAGAPALPLAQPRNVIGGQLLSALVGFAVVAVSEKGIWAAAVAGGLALGAMLILRVSHSPAAATAVIAALQSPPIIRFLALLALATVILVFVGIVGARTSGKKYPTYWW